MILFFNKAERPLWEGKTPIYSYIQEQSEPLAGALPDDEEFWAGSKMRWVAGGLDGALGHHYIGSEEHTDEVSGLVQLLAKHSRKPKNATRRALYAKLVKLDVGGKVDVILEELRKQHGVDPEGIFHEGKWLAENAAHRNAVKFGIALLGLFQNEQVKDLLLALGKHDEFTLYAAVAIQNGMEESNEVLFELAKHTHGWGKIHLVERLEPSSQEIKDWLLRYGCQNNVMNEYLACICARNGNLREVLSSVQVDRELFDGTSDIIEALLNGGPAEDIDNYEDAPQVVTDYVRLAQEMCSTAKHLHVIMELHDFLTQDEESWAERLSGEWTEALRQDAAEACRSLLTWSKWTGVIMDAVHSGSSHDRHYGVACAQKLGMDIWETLYSQLAQDPQQDYHYFQLMKSDDPERIGRLVQFAIEHLPLQEIAVGPADELGLGKEYAAHRILDTILQSLDRFEGIGSQLILAGLNSPVVRNRNMALKALEGWNVEAWGGTLIEAVVHLSAVEPVDSVKERLSQLRKAKGV
jgi:hypothetical protein